MTTQATSSGSAPDPATPLLALRAQLNASIHSLWTVYAAVGGAAAAFGSGPAVTKVGAGAVTGMFLLFTSGHLALLRQSLRASEAMRLDLAEALKAKRLASSLLQKTLREGAGNRNPLGKNTNIHLSIDVFVIGAIWAKFVFQYLRWDA